MPRRSKASSLSLALLLGCGDGTAATTDAATTTTSPATSTSAAATTGTTTGLATDTTAATTSTGDPSGGSSSSGAAPGPCEDSVVDWDNFAHAFMLSWCTGCHHAALPTADRAGAPCDTNFNVHAGASGFAGLMQLRVLDHEALMIPPMPPAAIIPDGELALLREWIQCGAPGPETGQPVPCCPDPGPDDTCP